MEFSQLFTSRVISECDACSACSASDKNVKLSKWEKIFKTTVIDAIIDLQNKTNSIIEAVKEHSREILVKERNLDTSLKAILKLVSL